MLFRSTPYPTLFPYTTLFRSPRPELTGSSEEPLSLDGEYNRLFVGVGKPAVCMWESVYATGNASLFQENTLAVRRIYERFGLQSRDYPRVADDHLAIELAFMRELALRAMQGQAAERNEVLAAQLDFIEKHLGTWVGSFAIQVNEQDRTGHYRNYASLLDDFIELDREVLSLLTAKN